MNRLEAMKESSLKKMSHFSWVNGFFELTDRGFVWDNGDAVDIAALPYEGYKEYVKPPPEPKLISWYKPILSTKDYKGTKWYNSKDDYINSHISDGGSNVIGWLTMKVLDRAPDDPLDAPEIDLG